MPNPFVGLLIKAMKAVAVIIIKQISDYVASEEFKAQVKVVLKMVVERMVKIVMHEKKVKVR